MKHGVRAYQEQAERSRQDEFVSEHLGLVRHVVGRLQARLPSYIDGDDLVQAGLVGLVQASQSFDPNRGVPFAAFARARIEGSILDELRRNCPLPQAMRQRIARLKTATESAAPGASKEAIAEAAGLTNEEAEECRRWMESTDPSSSEASWRRLSTSIAPDQDAEREDLMQQVADAIETLPEAERLAVTLYYMEDLRQKEIAQVLGVTASGVSRMLHRGLDRLREVLQRDGEPTP